MTDFISVKTYPAQGIKRLEFFGSPLAEDFDMVGVIVSCGINALMPVLDMEAMYGGGIKIENEDGTVSYPNAPFFKFLIDDRESDASKERELLNVLDGILEQNHTLFNIPLGSIPCSRYKGFFCGSKSTYQDKGNGYSLPLSLKQGMTIQALIEYPLHKVALPSGKDNQFEVVLIGKEKQ